MKKILLTTASAIVMVLFLFGINTFHKNDDSNKRTITSKSLVTKPEAEGFVFVELFTSEGCSSCPPADELVNKLAKENRQNVFMLSYHVDYWNRLGWKDKFSKAEFSNRQRQYAAYFNKEGVYTPQIVVNGTTEFVGSDEKKLYASINDVVGAAHTSPIYITATATQDQIVVSYKINQSERASLYVALVLLSGSTQVGNGENEGRLLRHTNIVTDLKSIAAGTQKKEIAFKTPAAKNFLAAGYKVVAFLQHDDGRIIAATDCAIKDASF